ncbi:MAG: aspartate ammonia-lyase [Bacteroidales bacterium]|nr:aspartate ammonia-lyase [Bacteroidales bacterium]
MENSEILKLIKGIDLFFGLNKEELNSVAEDITEVVYEPGDFLFKEKAPRKNLFIISEGQVELFKITSIGQEKRLSVFFKGDFLGEGSWDEASFHYTSARAITKTKVLVLGKSYFSENGQQAVKVYSNIVRVISRRMRYANSRIMNTTAQYESTRTRTEHDLLGERQVPYEYYYGIQTIRALENFNISGVTINFYPNLIKAIVIVKKAAAFANFELGLLDKTIFNAIVQACDEIISGRYQFHFVVDMIQGGAGTSTNMNANEVIANRALEIMGHDKGQYEFCHPNNHVNLSQSTNDAYPTAIKLALIYSNESLITDIEKLIGAFKKKAREFAQIIKMGRTQLQDAVPMTLGQSFEVYAITMDEEVQRLDENAKLLLEVNMGGTAIGTGINADPEYSSKVIKQLQRITKLQMVNAKNLVEATQDTGSYVMYSSAIKRLAIKLSKISNDLRLLSSGPRTGINEINLPPVQPGSSIMPGKVNPVIPEVVNQIAFKVIGNDLTVSLAAEAGQLELNVMEPIIVQSLFESIEMLKNGISTLRTKCVVGITANEAHCKEMVENSIGIITALNPVLGYETSSMLAKEALETNQGVYKLVLEKKLLTKKELDLFLSPEHMVKPYRLRKQKK